MPVKSLVNIWMGWMLALAEVTNLPWPVCLTGCGPWLPGQGDAGLQWCRPDRDLPAGLQAGHPPGHRGRDPLWTGTGSQPWRWHGECCCHSNIYSNNNCSSSNKYCFERERAANPDTECCHFNIDNNSNSNKNNNHFRRERAANADMVSGVVILTFIVLIIVIRIITALNGNGQPTLTLTWWMVLSF